MTTKYALLSAVLTIAMTFPLLGQGTRNDTNKTELKQPDMSSMMGKPTVDTAVGGVQMKVWLMTQDRHKEMMKEKMGQTPTHREMGGDMGKMEARELNSPSMVMAKEMKGLQRDGMAKKATSMSTDNDTVEAIQGSASAAKAVVDSITGGTHHIVLDVTEIASGKEIAGASARVLIESPSNKNSSVDLKPMMDHFGSALTLDEKGEYRFTVKVSFGGAIKTTQFQYAVK